MTSGFTLLEVVVSLALLAVGVAIGVPLLITATGKAEGALMTRMAVGIAQSRLDEAGITYPLAAGTIHGVIRDRFRWQVRVMPAPDVLPANPYGLAAYDLTVIVDWRDGLARRNISLRSLRLGRAP